jgi:hypothetical protein
MFIRATTCALAAFSLTACHPFKSLSCHAPKEYERSVQRPPLKIPEGLDAPSTQGALTIPDVTRPPPPRGDKTPCLEEPPVYKSAPGKPVDTHN